MRRMKEIKTILSTFELGDMTLCYVKGNESGTVGIRLLPKGMESLCVNKECGIEPLVQVKLLGDDYAGGFGQGRTMRDCATIGFMDYDRQDVREEDGILCIDTFLKDNRGFTYVHHLEYRKGSEYIVTSVSFTNNSELIATLEMLSSFTLGELTPFIEDDAPEVLEFWRMRSNWSAEGRLVHESVENAHLEPSWAGFGAFTTRWGQVGSMPNREYAPFAAIEDKVFGSIWAVQLTHASSWQLEAGRHDNGFCLSGGLADREFGHWMKDILPGESFTTPDAIITVTMNGIEDACERLIQYTVDRLDVPESEETLPPMFNEWCTTWGFPYEDSIAKIADAIEHLGLEYFTIDAGWYAETPGKWSSRTGEWNISPALYTRGLEWTLDYLRSRGLKPGIWFEFESVGRDCVKFHQTDLLLSRDDIPLTVGERRFWDFRKEEARAYLREKVIEFLRKYGFKYIKVDYNDTVGIGVDGAESLGEGLREQICAVQDFFRELHAELPDVVIEICSSGGHRLVPSFLTIGSMASFSDAHECEEIPIVAANMHRIIPPRQNQIWSVLHTNHSEAMLYYKITSGFLGRLCLSGDVLDMSKEQWAVIDKCVDFYRKAAPVIKEGKSRRYGPALASWRHPKGWQAMVRTGKNNALAVIHTFANAPQTVRFPVPEGYEICETCFREGIKLAHSGDQLIITGIEDYDGLGILLNKL